MAEWLSNISNVLLIVIGFGLVILIHELGHFLAARWAGIRVHAFAIGFGPAICSWRKGLGFRVGSSESDYLKRVEQAGGATATSVQSTEGVVEGVYPTEYRLNWLPLGGYVKMLGQEDLDPTVSSSAPDSFNRKPVWKRMIVISAGVVMNLILAAVLFMAVFMAGMRETAAIVGDVGAKSPARAAGLLPGDVIVSINGRPAESFVDLQVAAAMSGRGTLIELVVRRDGKDVPIGVKPSPGGPEKFMQIGVGPAASATTWSEPRTKADRAEMAKAIKRIGVPGLGLNEELVSINGRANTPVEMPDGRSIALAESLFSTIAASHGAPVTAVFRDAAGVEHPVAITPQPVFQNAWATVTDARSQVEHLLGLMPAMKVREVTSDTAKEILKPGDIFARIGAQDWPDVATGIREIKANKGKSVPMVLLRDGALVEVSAPVSSKGLVGFGPSSATDSNIVASPSDLFADAQGEQKLDVPTQRIVPGILPGMRIVSVAGTSVSNFSEIRTAIREATQSALTSSAGASVPIEFAPPIGAPERANEQLALSLAPTDVRAIHELSWSAPEGLAEFFQPASVLQRAKNPIAALGMGLRKTQRSMVLTYMTFARLFEGTVRVEHLKGPVGIAHIGSRFAAEGMVYLLYFLALISVNLAVINFLPIPIVDGGLFTMLIVEGLTRRPVPARVQNALTLVGLLLIGTVFIVVTFNDVAALF